MTPLRLLPICRSLDLWQHAFTCEIDAVNQADPTESDEEAVETVGTNCSFQLLGVSCTTCSTSKCRSRRC